MSFQSYIKIKGQKQGQFKGESKKKGREQWMEFHEYSMACSSPRDAASGLPTGHRQHKPVSITKERGVSSPQILQALWTNETMTEVIIEIVGRSVDGAKEIVVERITLTNASIADVKRYAEASTKTAAIHDVDFVETVQFTFQKIDVEDVVGGTMASDDWQTPSI